MLKKDLSTSTIEEKDNLAKESLGIEITLDNEKYNIINVKGDGNCLFRAIVEGCKLIPDLPDFTKSHQLLRSAIVEQLSKPEYVEPIKLTIIQQRSLVQGNAITLDLIREYIANMSKDGSWGGDVELVALAKTLNIRILVFIVEGRENGEMIFAPGNVYDNGNITEDLPSLRLVFMPNKDTHSVANHYNLLVPKNHVRGIIQDFNISLVEDKPSILKDGSLDNAFSKFAIYRERTEKLKQNKELDPKLFDEECKEIEMYFQKLLRGKVHDFNKKGNFKLGGLSEIKDNIANILACLGNIYTERGKRKNNVKLLNDAALLCNHAVEIYASENDKNNTIADLYKQLAIIQKQIGLVLNIDCDALEKISPLEMANRDKTVFKKLREYCRSKLSAIQKKRDDSVEKENFEEAQRYYVEEIESIHKYITSTIKEFLAKKVCECEQLLGPKPCNYAVVGLGSMALNQMTPYSDLEFAFLIEDAFDTLDFKEIDAEKSALKKNNENKNYFRRLSELLHFMIMNLGESAIPSSKFNINLDNLTRRGINFDLGGKTPLGREDKPYELIQTPFIMAKYLEEKYEYVDRLLPHVLETSTYVYGSVEIHKDFLNRVNNYLEFNNLFENNRITIYQQRAAKRLKGMAEASYNQSKQGIIKAFKGDLENFKPEFFQEEDEGKLFDVKQEVYRLPDRLLYDLAIFFGMIPSSAWDAIRRLKEKNIIGFDEHTNKDPAKNLLSAVSYATELRLRVYLQANSQSERIGISPPHALGQHEFTDCFYFKDDEITEIGALFRYYYTVIPLHAAISSLIDPKESFQESKRALGRESFLKIDETTQGIVYKRLLNYPKAIEKFEAALVKSPKDIYIKNFLVSVLERTGRFEQALKYHEEVFQYLRSIIVNNSHVESDSPVTKKYNDKQQDENGKLFHSIVLQNICQKGNLFCQMDQPERALECYRLAWQTCNDKFNKNIVFTQYNYFYVVILNGMACALVDLKQFMPAMYFYNLLLVHLKQKYGEHSYYVASIYENIATVHQELYQFAQASENYSECLEVRKANYGDEHPMIARTLYNIGVLFRKSLNDQKALGYYNQALSIYRKFHIKEDVFVAHVNKNIGLLYKSLGEHEKAHHCLVEAKKIFLLYYKGKKHSQIAGAIFNIANNQYQASTKKGQTSDKQKIESMIYLLREFGLAFQVIEKIQHHEYFQVIKSSLGTVCSDLVNKITMQNNCIWDVEYNLEDRELLDEVLCYEINRTKTLSIKATSLAFYYLVKLFKLEGRNVEALQAFHHFKMKVENFTNPVKSIDYKLLTIAGKVAGIKDEEVELLSVFAQSLENIVEERRSNQVDISSSPSSMLPSSNSEKEYSQLRMQEDDEIGEDLAEAIALSLSLEEQSQKTPDSEQEKKEVSFSELNEEDVELNQAIALSLSKPTKLDNLLELPGEQSSKKLKRSIKDQNLSTDKTVNINAYYNEQQILKVWDCYIQSSKLKFYSDRIDGYGLFSSLFGDNESMSITKSAGIILQNDGKLYLNSRGDSISICGPVDHMSSIGAQGNYNGITHDMTIALKQIKSWNLNQSNKLKSHLVIFPYHISYNHWALGKLALRFSENNKIITISISILNPSPSIGGDKINSKVNDALEYITRMIFEDNTIEINNQKSKYNEKTHQQDSSSCGAISSENGKDFIDGSIRRLKNVYPSGARDLRLQHLKETNCRRFEEMQAFNEDYQSKLLQSLPDNISQIKIEWLKLASDLNFTEELKSIAETSNEDPIKFAQCVRNFFGDNQETINRLNLSLDEILFFKEKDELKFKDGAIDTIWSLTREIRFQLKSNKIYNQISIRSQSLSEIINKAEELRKIMRVNEDPKKQINLLCEIGDLYLKDNNFIDAASVYNFALGICFKHEITADQEQYVQEKMVEVEDKFLECLYISSQSNVAIIKQRKQELLDMRGRYDEKFEDSALSQKLHRKIYDKNTIFFKGLFFECINMLGQPPCKYSLIALGSNARKIATYYSDFEFAILIDDKGSKKESKQYFRNLSTLLNIMVINLGETTPKIQDIQPLKFLQDYVIIKNGFSFDGRMKGACKTPLGNLHHILSEDYNRHYELICTPEELASFQTLEWFEFDSHLPATLQIFDLLEGDEDLVIEYRKEIERHLSQDAFKTNGVPLQEYMSISLLSQDINRFEPNMAKQTEVGALYNIKYEIYRLPILILDYLAMKYKLTTNDPWERVDELFAKGIICEEGSKNLIKLINIITYLRTEAYNYYREQNDDLVPVKDKLTQNKFGISEENILYIYFYLIPLFDVFDGYYNLASANRKLDLHKHKFFDDSDLTIGRIYSKLYLADKAIFYLESEKKIYKDFRTVGEMADDQNIMISSLVHENQVNRYLAIAYSQKGDLDKAEQCRRELLQFCEGNSITKNSPSHASTISDLADLLAAQKKYDEAKSYYLQAIKMMTGLYGDNHPDLLITINNYNKLLIELGEFFEGYKLAPSFTNVGKKTFGKHFATSLFENNQVDVLMALNKYEEAEKVCKDALDNVVITYGSNHIYTFSYVKKYADILLNNKRYEQAKNYYSNALKIVIDNEKNYSKRTFSGLYVQIANTEAWLGQSDFAIEHLDQALFVLGNNCQADVNVAIIKVSKAKVLNSLRKFLESKPILLEAYNILTEVGVENHDIYSLCLRELMDVSYSTDHYDDVVKFASELIQKNEKVYGEQYEKNIELLGFLQVCYIKLDRQDDLLNCLLKELSIREVIFGELHEDTVEVLRKVRIQYERLGQKTEAEIYSKKYKDLNQKLHGDKFIIIADSMEEHENRKKLSKLSFPTNNQDLRKEEEAHKEKAILYGSNSIEIAHSIVELANGYGSQKRYKEAIEKFLEALEIFREVSKTSPENTYSIVATLSNIGAIYLTHLNLPSESLRFFAEAKDLFENFIDLEVNVHLVEGCVAILDMYGGAFGKLGEAEKKVQYQSQAYKLCQEYLGEYAPMTSKILNNLGNGYSELKDYEMAIQCYERALVIRNKIFGKDDIRTKNTEQSLYMVKFSRRADVYSEITDQTLRGEKVDDTKLKQLRHELAGQSNQFGLAHFRSQNYNKAIEMFSKAMGHSPSSELFYNRGRAFHEKGEIDLAIKDYNKAIELNPKYAKALYQLGVCSKKQGDIVKAKDCFEKALKEDSKLEAALKELTEFGKDEELFLVNQDCLNYEKLIENQQVTMLLSAITNMPFKAYLRDSKNYIVDAVYKMDHSENLEGYVQDLSRKLGLPFLLKNSDEQGCKIILKGVNVAKIANLVTQRYKSGEYSEGRTLH